jgi:hypothetical protein
MAEAPALFMRSLDEIHVDCPSAKSAVMLVARDLAEQIESGDLSPIDGANAIWDASVCLGNEHFPALDTFIYAASEWKGRPEDRPILERGILEAAREFEFLMDEP